MSPPEAAPRYLALGDGLRFAAGASEEIALDPISGRAHVLSAEQGRVLAALRGEHTLDGHVEQAAQRLGRTPEALRGLVLSLVVRGLLLEEAELRALVRGAPRPAAAALAPGSLVTLGIPTRGRPDSLVEAAQGHVSAALARGRHVTLVIADSSDDAGGGRSARRAPPPAPHLPPPRRPPRADPVRPRPRGAGRRRSVAC